MANKCRRAKGATLQLCDAAAHAVSTEMVRLQNLMDMETKKRRQRLAIVKGKEWAPLHFCPWCRADIDTRPRQPATPKEPA
ncbi:MAG: hypothetical protein RSD57_12400 [Comamonas sp.]